MVEDSRGADVGTLQTSGKLAQVEVFRREDTGGLSVFAELLEVVGQRSVGANGLECGLPKMLVFGLVSELV